MANAPTLIAGAVAVATAYQIGATIKKTDFGNDKPSMFKDWALKMAAYTAVGVNYAGNALDRASNALT